LLLHEQLFSVSICLNPDHRIETVMVVAKVVHIRNNTLRYFSVSAGDYFYTPQIDEVPCINGIIDVPPGFDQTIEGLVVPWEKLSSSGLEISERGTDELVRCIVGPLDMDNNDRDWLQFRNCNWEKVGHDQWVCLGKRHILGTVGGSVEIQMTFRDARSQPSEEQAGLVEVLHFDRAIACAPPNTVFLNVFDLASALSIPNAMLCNTVFNTIGAFHAAVEVYGEEWSFYRTPNPKSCGVCKSLRPRHHPLHVYRQSVNLGPTSLKEWEVRYLVRGQLATRWPGGAYDLLHRNCIHFCEELQLCLGVRPVPPWVKGLHETGASLHDTGASVWRIPWSIFSLFGGSDAEVNNKNAIEGGESYHSPAGTEIASCSGTSTADVTVTDRRVPTDPHQPPVDGSFIFVDRT